MQSEKARTARIRAQLDRLKAQYVNEERVLRAIFDAAGLDGPSSTIDARWLVPSCPPAPLSAIRG